VFENQVLRIFGQKRDEETGGWRKLHKEELHNLYSSPSIIRIITILLETPEGERPLGRPIRRWMDNNKIDFTRDRMGWYGLI
jgi:hypothetical protein